MFISYEVELQIPYSIVYSNLKEISCVDLSKGKILFHMTFPYREVCDLEQYSICPKIQKTSIEQRSKFGTQKWDNPDSGLFFYVINPVFKPFFEVYLFL